MKTVRSFLGKVMVSLSKKKKTFRIRLRFDAVALNGEKKGTINVDFLLCFFFVILAIVSGKIFFTVVGEARKMAARFLLVFLFLLIFILICFIFLSACFTGKVRSGMSGTSESYWLPSFLISLFFLSLFFLFHRRRSNRQNFN